MRRLPGCRRGLFQFFSACAGLTLLSVFLCAYLSGCRGGTRKGISTAGRVGDSDSCEVPLHVVHLLLGHLVGPGRRLAEQRCSRDCLFQHSGLCGSMRGNFVIIARGNAAVRVLPR